MLGCARCRGALQPGCARSAGPCSRDLPGAAVSFSQGSCPVLPCPAAGIRPVLPDRSAGICPVMPGPAAGIRPAVPGRAAQGDGEIFLGRRTPGRGERCGRKGTRSSPEKRSRDISQEHPAWAVPDLPESPPPQAVGATTRSFPEVSLSVVNRKGKKAPPTQFPSGRMEAKRYFVWFMLVQASLFPHLFEFP